MTEQELEEFKRRLEKENEIEEAQRRKQREKEDLKVTRLMVELNKMTKLIPEEEIDLQEVFKEAEAYYKAILFHKSMVRTV